MAAASRRIASEFDDAWHEDAVSPRFEVAHRALDRLGEDVPPRAGEVGVSAGVQHEGAAGRRGAGSRDAVGGLVDAEQPILPGVLEIGAHRPDLHGPGHGSTDVAGCVCVSSFEVRGHRHADCGHDASDVPEHRVAVQRSPVRDSAGPGDARTGRGDGREADLLQDAGGAGIPGVGEYEPGTTVQGKKGCCLAGRRSGDHEATVLTSAKDAPPESRT